MPSFGEQMNTSLWKIELHRNKNLAILSPRAGAAVLHDPPIITPDQIKYKEHNTVNLAWKKIRYFSKNFNVRKIFI